MFEREIPLMSPAPDPEGKAVKNISVGLPAETAAHFDELRWQLREKSDRALALRLVREAMAAYAHLLKPRDPPSSGSSEKTPPPGRRRQAS